MMIESIDIGNLTHKLRMIERTHHMTAVLVVLPDSTVRVLTSHGKTGRIRSDTALSWALTDLLAYGPASKTLSAADVVPITADAPRRPGAERQGADGRQTS